MWKEAKNSKKQKQKKNAYKPPNWAVQIQNIMKSMEDSPFFYGLKEQLDGLVESGVFNVHCYGLGSPSNSRSSRHQAALLVTFKTNLAV